MVAIERIWPAIDDCHRAAVVVVIGLADTLEMVTDLAPICEGVGIH
jgi:hypothetical protein